MTYIFNFYSPNHSANTLNFRLRPCLKPGDGGDPRPLQVLVLEDTVNDALPEPGRHVVLVGMVGLAMGLFRGE